MEGERKSSALCPSQIVGSNIIYHFLYKSPTPSPQLIRGREGSQKGGGE